MEATQLKQEIDSDIETVIGENKPEVMALWGREDLEFSHSDPAEAIKFWERVFENLSISGVTDMAGYTNVSKAIALCRTTRTTLDKLRKEKKEFYLTTGRMIDKKFNGLLEKIEPIEAALQAKKKVIDDEKERIKKEKEEAAERVYIDRRTKLVDLGATFNGTNWIIDTANPKTSFYLPDSAMKAINELEFNAVMFKAQEVKKIVDAQKEEAARLKREELEREAKERADLQRQREEQAAKEQEMEKRLEEIERKERELQEAEERRQREEREAQLREEMKIREDKLEKERQAERVEIQTRAAEKALQDEKNRVALEAEEKERKRQEAEEKERKKLERRPDRSKLLAFVETIPFAQSIALKSPEAKAIHEKIDGWLKEVIDNAKDEIAKL